MPILSTVTGSFFAGRRASAFAGVPWDPSTDISPALWMDASDASSYTLNFNNIQSITDKSSNSVGITVTGTPQLIGAVSGLNNLPIIAFDGTEDFTATLSHQVTNGNHWAIGVMKWQSRDDPQDSFWSIETNESPKRDYAISAGTSNFDGELDLDGLSSNRISSTIGNKQDFDSGIAQNTWIILVAIFNRTGNQIAIRANGTNKFTPVNDYDNSLSSNQDVRIFRNRANERMGGSLAEWFSVADIPGTGGTDISTVEAAEGYLAHKWGLTGSLPVGHPYKNSAP